MGKRDESCVMYASNVYAKCLIYGFPLQIEKGEKTLLRRKKSHQIPEMNTMRSGAHF